LIAAYFDESSDAKAERVFTLGTYIALARDWVHDFEPPWEELLKKHNLDYFRATDCENGAGPFEQFRSNPFPLPLSTEDKTKLTQIKTEFVDLALSLRYMWGLGVNVFVDDLRSLLRSEPKAEVVLGTEPYLIGYQILLSKIGLMAKGFNDAQGKGFQRHMVGFVFDEKKDMRYRAKVQYERFQSCNPESSTWMASLTFGDDRKVLELQAADNLAFEVRKNCFNRRFDKRKERVALTRLKDRIGIIYDLDLRSLKALLDHNLNLDSIVPNSDVAVG
jgi:hypothetical protein